MHSLIKQYCVLVGFLGKALGPDYEIVLHDLTTVDHKVAAIVNNHISGRTTGAPLTDLALQFLADKVYKDSDYIVNYRGVSKQNSRLRSSTMFIKDEKDKPIGMLCINYDTSKYFAINDLLGKLCRIPQEDSKIPGTSAASSASEENKSEDLILTPETTETFADSIPDVIQATIANVLEVSDIPPDRLTQNEKLLVVDELNKKGVFLLKGAVSEVAGQLASSEATIYRYLSKLKHEEGRA